jgi:hypothetical protein
MGTNLSSRLEVIEIRQVFSKGHRGIESVQRISGNDSTLVWSGAHDIVKVSARS